MSDRRSDALAKHVAVVLSVSLVAVLYVADKWELQRKIAMREGLLALQAVREQVDAEAGRTESGEAQQRIALALASDSLLYVHHVAWRNEVAAIAKRFGGTKAVNGKFQGEGSSFQLLYLPRTLGEDLALAPFRLGEADRSSERIASGHAEVLATLEATCRVFVPTRLDTALLVQRLGPDRAILSISAAGDTLWEPDEDGVDDPSYATSVRTVHVDSTILCVNRRVAQNSQTGSNPVVCPVEVPIDSGTWAFVPWRTVLGIAKADSARMADPVLAAAGTVYADLTIQQATDLLQKDIIAAYGSFELFGVAVRVHYLAGIMAVVLLGSVLLSFFLANSDVAYTDELAPPAIPLLLRSPVVTLLLLFALPVVAVVLSVPHYDITVFHRLLITALLLAYVLVAWQLVRPPKS